MLGSLDAPDYPLVWITVAVMESFVLVTPTVTRAAVTQIAMRAAISWCFGVVTKDAIMAVTPVVVKTWFQPAPLWQSDDFYIQ